MNKALLAVLFVLLPVLVQATDLSWGVGVGWNPTWDTLKQSLGSDWVTSETSSPENLGGQVFFDLTYLQFSLGYLGTGPYYLASGSDSSGAQESLARHNGFSGGWLTSSVVLKYPIRNGKLRYFPLLGLEADENLSYTDAGGNDLRGSLTQTGRDNLNHLWVKLGLGGDIPWGKEAYLRLAVSGAIRFLNPQERELLDAIKASGIEKASLLHFRLSTEVSIGFKVGTVEP